MNRRIIALGGLLSLAGVALTTLCGCKTLEVIGQVGAQAMESAGVVTHGQAESISRTTSAVAKTFEDITPEQEYYIGRAVAAQVLGKYPAWDNNSLNRYLNKLGQSLAAFSTRPETFGGYHFLALDTDDINAFAAPGGLIVVSRGLIRCCETEDALAAVLAHEIGHVELMHGLRAIRANRLTGALTTLASESAKNLGGAQLAELTTAFEGSISDITATMVNSGYSKALEYAADRAAVQILRQSGYAPEGLVAMLVRMQAGLKPGRHDFGATHPAPADRIKQLKPLMATVPVIPARQARFLKAVNGV